VIWGKRIQPKLVKDICLIMGPKNLGCSERRFQKKVLVKDKLRWLVLEDISKNHSHKSMTRDKIILNLCKLAEIVKMAAN